MNRSLFQFTASVTLVAVVLLGAGWPW